MNTFGTRFRITSFGESHGAGVGVVVDGCPAGVRFDTDFLQSQLDRRRPGQSHIVTQRKEADAAQILSGVFDGMTTGAPIAVWMVNTDAKSKDYEHLAHTFRPSHADYTHHLRYEGFNDPRGGGRTSARITAGWVAAGAIAQMLLRERGVSVMAYVCQVGDVKLERDYDTLDLTLTDTNPVRCPDPATAAAMIALIEGVKKEGDTVGGIVRGVIRGVPAGIGDPVFRKLHAVLGAAMLTINAAKGFEYGSGFEGATMRGSAHNDIFYAEPDTVPPVIRTRSNHSGGIQGGVSNGMDITFRVAFKPVATILRPQPSVTSDGEPTTVAGRGRHDPCVVPRAVPIVEAMAALVLADYLSGG